MGIAAGKLDRRITIQVATVVRDAANDVVLTYSESNPANFDLWANKADQRGFETQGSQQLIRTADTVFEVRQGPKALTIHPDSHRIVFKGKVFTIVSIQEGKERNDTLQLLTSSRPDGGGARGQGNTNGV
jgi:head-tail adaptor